MAVLWSYNKSPRHVAAATTASLLCPQRQTSSASSVHDRARAFFFHDWTAGYLISSASSVSLNVRFGSFASGSSQQQVGPCPLYPDSDQILHLAEMTRRANYRHRAPAKAAAIRLALVSLLQLIGYLVECGLDAGFVFLAARCARSSSACLRRSLASRPVRITRGSERRQKPRAIPPNKGEPICRRPGLENPRQRLPTVLS